MKQSCILIFSLFASAVLSALGTDLPLVKFQNPLSVKSPFCKNQDLFVAVCAVCTAVTYFTNGKEKCLCDKLTLQQGMKLNEFNKKGQCQWLKNLKKVIIDKCIKEYKCKCKGCAGTGGDPHFRTLDGILYSYHGECDLVMAHSPSYGSGLGLDIHGRTSIVGDWSLISNVALRVGTDIFEIANDGTHYFNGQSDFKLPIALAGKYNVTKGEDSIESFDQNDGQDITQTIYSIILENDDKILLSVFKHMISVSVQGRLEGTHGMLGTADISGLVGRDGVTIHDDFNRMGADWQVNPEIDSDLFHDVSSGPQYPEQCKLPTVTGRRLRQHSESSRRLAEEVCSIASSDLKEKCVGDVLLTGDVNIAHGYAF